MGLITWIKEKFKMLFKTDAEKAFGVETYLSPEMDAAIKLWGQLESGKPPWVKGDTRTIRFSNTVARELAKLITQNIDIKVQSKYGTGETAKRIQKAIDDAMQSDDPAVQAYWKKIKYKGEKPTPEEVVLYIAKQVKAY